ncbi:hypothetical protein Vadar_018586 [Vaccinium darrowii]|uniref:Uncharacterized protein n=1 Tax=Vaccinium darrowii TaxID=229202 RepID=A0ACB7XAX6_9ERIC|nr:hypothetical protein Vadar_018586 [Vaccinium darrowii]
MQLFVNELWHPRQPVFVVARRLNFFVFHFYAKEDMDHAVSRGPWLIRRGLLVLDYWHFYDALEHIKVRRFSMWVQLHNLPFEAFTREAGEILGQALGEEVTVDVDDVFSRQFRYLRVCISLTQETTLVPGFFFDIPGGQPRWIECRYERLYKFCRSCGRIGHTYPQCDMSRDEARARMDAMLNQLCERFGTATLHGDIPLASHVDLGDPDQSDGATQTVSGDENFEMMPVAIDFDQFLEDYEAAWDWGLQHLNAGIFQRGDLVVFPTSPDDHVIEVVNDVVGLHVEAQVPNGGGNEQIAADTFERVVSELPWILEVTTLEVDVMDQRWTEWERVARRFGVNVGRWWALMIQWVC